MNKITKIYYHKKNSSICDVYFSDTKKITLDNSYIGKYFLVEGSEISDKQLEKIVSENEYDRAKEKAFFLLTYRDHSVYELKVKLRKRNFDEKVIDKTVEYLLENGYLNDKKFSEIYLNELLNTKRSGMMIIRKKLFQKGLSRELINNLLNDLDDEIFHNNCLFHLQKKRKLLEKKHDENIKNKLYNYLSRKGFRYEIILNVFENENI
ncbi:MAG: regulatory protein RecX [Candidatus Marinimicrobia bacterium]|jgi:regulatory protein|nr:regulatory protein RecX [Candidatus Neomarinimicrobiota bacterium]